MTKAPAEGLATFVLLAFNQEKYVREAVRAALAQDYSPLAIIISDDTSTDSTFQIIEEEVAGYQGPHRIRLNRNEKNLGACAHVNLVISMAETNFVVLAAGDDVSMPERTRVLVDAYCKAGTQHFYASSNADIIGSDGRPTGGRVICGPAPDNPERHARGSAMPLGASEAFTKSLLDFFGDMHQNLVNEDFVMPLRAHLLGKVAYVDLPLIRYRVGAGSVSQDDARLARPDLLARRARYLAQQQIAVADMLHDVCFFCSRAGQRNGTTVHDDLKRILLRRLARLAVAESFNRYRSQGRWLRSGLELVRAPQVLFSMMTETVRRVLKAGG